MKIGIDIGGSHIAIGVIDKNLIIIEKTEKRLTSIEKRNLRKSIEDYIIENVKKLREKYNITAIGIAMPGSSKNGIVESGGNLKLKDYDLGGILYKNLNLPITIRNDAKCAAIAENSCGCLKGYKRSVFLTLGTGIGGAVFEDGKLKLAGEHDGYEFGHMVINTNGIECYCGRKGCFERYASMKALKNNLRNVLGLDEKTRGEELLEIIRKNKPGDMNYNKIENIVNEYIENLSTGIINLIEIFSPEVIGIGGSFVHFENVLLPRLKDKIKFDVVINTAVLGNDAGIIGAIL